MKRFSYYHKETGELHSMRTSFTDHPGHEKDAADSAPKDHAHIEGHHDRMRMKVDLKTMKVVPHGRPLPTPVDTTMATKLREAQAKKWHLNHEVHPHLVRECLLDVKGAKEKLQALHDEVLALDAVISDVQPAEPAHIH